VCGPSGSPRQAGLRLSSALRSMQIAGVWKRILLSRGALKPSEEAVDTPKDPVTSELQAKLRRIPGKLRMGNKIRYPSGARTLPPSPVQGQEPSYIALGSGDWACHFPQACSGVNHLTFSE
jgi:hypothetical protein